MVSLVLFTVVFSSAAVDAPTLDAINEEPTQFLRLGHGNSVFPFLVAANADLYNLQRDIRQVIVLVQDAERPIPATVLTDSRNTLILAPKFLDASDRRTQFDLPVWTHNSWSQGDSSALGLTGVSALAVLDGLIAYLEQPQRFPVLSEIVLIGDGAGNELLRLHASEHRRQRVGGIVIRYRQSGRAVGVPAEGH